MTTTKKKMSIDELARRLRDEWRRTGTHELLRRNISADWVAVARLARKLESQPAATEGGTSLRKLVQDAARRARAASKRKEKMT